MPDEEIVLCKLGVRGQYFLNILRWEFIKENKKVRKKEKRTRPRKRSRKKENKEEKKNSTKKAIKKTRKRPRKKEKTFFFSWSLSWSSSFFLFSHLRNILKDAKEFDLRGATVYGHNENRVQNPCSWSKSSRWSNFVKWTYKRLWLDHLDILFISKNQ